MYADWTSIELETTANILPGFAVTREQFTGPPRGGSWVLCALVRLLAISYSEKAILV